jgi:hypothetical protein
VEIAHRIWLRRNSVVHGGDFLHPNEVILSVTNAIIEYKGALEIDIPSLDSDDLGFSHGMSLWRLPPSEIFKAKWDATLNSKRGKLGFGSVVCDSQGVVFAVSSHSVNACVDPVVAEALVALHTMEFRRNRGLTSIILEGDSLLVDNAINMLGFNWSLLGNIISDIQGILYGFHNWKVQRTNAVAHFLAKDGVNQESKRKWMDCIPDCIRLIVLSEIYSRIV